MLIQTSWQSWRFGLCSSSARIAALEDGPFEEALRPLLHRLVSHAADCPTKIDLPGRMGTGGSVSHCDPSRR